MRNAFLLFSKNENDITIITVSTLIVVGIIFGVILDSSEVEDITGIISLGLMLTFASMVIGIFATALQKLLQEAIDIKSVNDLIV